LTSGRLAVAAVLLFAGLAFSQEADEAEKYWSVDAEAGYTFTSGNSDTEDARAGITGLRENMPWKTKLTLRGERGKSEGETTKSVIAGEAKQSWYATDRTYLYARTAAKRDTVNRIALRSTTGAGVGHEFIKREDLTLAGEGGVEYEYFEPVEGEIKRDMLLRLAENLEWQINESAKLTQSLEFFPNLTDSKRHRTNAEVALTTGLTERVSVRVGVAAEYQNRPPEDSKHTDVTGFVALVVSIL